MTKETTSTERALKLALEALEPLVRRAAPYGELDWLNGYKTITALREALTSVPDWASEAREQPAQQEPTKVAVLVDALIAKYSDKLYDSVGPHDAAKFEEDCNHIKQALAQQQEPVAYWIPKAEQFCIASPSSRPFAKAWEPLYTSPPAQRKPLTDEELVDVASNCGMNGLNIHGYIFARAIEAAHGITAAPQLKENT